MAVTSIWPIKGSPEKVINYVRNPEKTREKKLEDVSALHAINGVIEYDVNSLKTEERKYVTVLNCSSEETAAQQFMNTKRMKKKLDGRACFHGYQSFKPGEVTAEIAHDIGVKLAQRLWPDFEVVVATHCNTDCYHNHFCINSVSCEDGHHYHNTPVDYRRMRQESDRLCQEYGLSVIESPRGRGRNYAEYKAQQEGRPTVRGMIRADIDRAINASITNDDFFDFLEEAGYRLKLYDKQGDWLLYPSLQPPGAKGFFRFHKLGKGYDLDEISRRIQRVYVEEDPFPEEERRQVREYRKHSPPPLYQRTSLYRLYLRYCYELHIIERHPASVQRVSFHLREDLMKLDRLDRQTRMLARLRINTGEELLDHKSSVQQEISKREARRAELRNDLKRAKRRGDFEEVSSVKEQIAACSAELRDLHKEVKDCDDILVRSARTRKELEWVLGQQQDQEIGKEEQDNEQYFQRRGGTGRAHEPGGR